jgi:hypothetical protein
MRPDACHSQGLIPMKKQKAAKASVSVRPSHGGIGLPRAYRPPQRQFLPKRPMKRQNAPITNHIQSCVGEPPPITNLLRSRDRKDRGTLRRQKAPARYRYPRRLFFLEQVKTHQRSDVTRRRSRDMGVIIILRAASASQNSRSPKAAEESRLAGYLCPATALIAGPGLPRLRLGLPWCWRVSSPECSCRPMVWWCCQRYRLPSRRYRRRQECS